MKYFAYGSNMSFVRLIKRVPSAKRLGMFSLKNHQLVFHKVSQDGSSKCDALFTNNVQDCIFGALYEIDENEKRILDHAEGLGHGYDEKLVQVEDSNGKIFEAVAYIATKIDDSLLPYSWYLNHVVVGAKEIGVPEYYLEKILNIKALEDPDQDRDREQRKMYR
ncbi:gamma-glutamylcyclotransferase family protein [Celerinatantimonas diazotrophica]|uniref:AIG2 family protein n=1 Tax=Celerinatantimonas diazotrophica TaxID=412034 RepID=A0A4R1JAJ0_9GAMM|nr:gamma-glutamylcyclotransferase family protein [Celerinatantimonas diazotrophica]TCK47507.1 AIG2 family protein [Celerinatantimonas diazotrophica]CAG9296875.1 hypothetical protein CEDIAZO_02034 [Celerinatantimonas diazotrophica]